MKPLLERRPLKPFIIMLVLGVLVAASGWSLEWNLESLATAENRAQAWERFTSFFVSFGSPDRSYTFMHEVYGHAFDTIAIALLGVAMASVFAFVIALTASQRIMVRGSGPMAWLQRALVECSRLFLDVLRGVPDFVWAVMMVAIFGLGPMAGLFAITLNVTGILGKMYSELWDNLSPKRYEALQVTGVGRTKLLLYGLQPLAGRGMISFTLMRTECAVRNASVIGIVGGGGLGSAMREELGYGEWAKVATLLMAMVTVTVATDFISTFLRYQLRNDPNATSKRLASPRSQITRTYMGIIGVFALLAWSVSRFWDALTQAASDFFVWKQWVKLYDLYEDLFSPDLSSEALATSWHSALFPIAVAVIGTLLGVLGAAALAFPASKSMNRGARNFTGEKRVWWREALRAVQSSSAKGFALLARAIPEVSWVLILMAFFKASVLAAILAIALHTAGVLARVFTESIDDHPYRYYERNFLGSRRRTFVYAGVTRSWRDWLTYAFFQFESNVRIGVVLGMIGEMGLGFRFGFAWSFLWYDIAATHLITMVALTVIIDRTSRALKLSRIAR